MDSEELTFLTVDSVIAKLVDVDSDTDHHQQVFVQIFVNHFQIVVKVRRNSHVEENVEAAQREVVDEPQKVDAERYLWKDPSDFAGLFGCYVDCVVNVIVNVVFFKLVDDDVELFLWTDSLLIW